MATYRCPECGAPHKEHLAACRLCGAPLDVPVTVRSVTIDRSIAAERFKRKGLGHFVIIGLVLACAIGLAAFFLGGAEDSDAERWFYRLPFIDPPIEDAWFEWADPGERLVVEVPARLVELESFDAPDLGGDTEVWETAVGQDRIFIGLTEGLGFEVPPAVDGDDRTGSTTEEALSDAVAALAESQGGYVQRTGELITVGDGHLGLDAVIDGIGLPDGPGFGSVRIAMVDDEIYYVETVGYTRNGENHRRLRGSIVVVADDPDMVIPTIPADAPEPGGLVSRGDDD